KIDNLGRAAFGCNDYLISPILNGFFDRSYSQLSSLMDCVKTSIGATGNKITPAQLKNQAFLASICPGGVGKCPRAYCDALVANFTGSDRSSFCGAATTAASEYKRCASNYVVNKEKSGDLECANMLAETVVAAYSGVSWIELYNLLSCDGQNRD